MIEPEAFGVSFYLRNRGASAGIFECLMVGSLIDDFVIRAHLDGAFLISRVLYFLNVLSLIVKQAVTIPLPGDSFVLHIILRFFEFDDLVVQF